MFEQAAEALAAEPLTGTIDFAQFEKVDLRVARVLAAGPGGSDIFLLAPDHGAKPGQRVH